MPLADFALFPLYIFSLSVIYNKIYDMIKKVSTLVPKYT